MYQIIPLAQIPAQTVNMVLNGQSCTIRLYWRQTRLYLDLRVGPAVVCKGAICQNRASIVQSVTPLFEGSLHFYDTRGDCPPRHEGLGERWFLVYVSEDSPMPEPLRY